MQVTLDLTSAIPKIENASPAWQREFGIDIAACRGRSLALILGPDSNTEALTSLLQTVQNGKHANSHLVFYTSTGTGALYRLYALPCYSYDRCEVKMSRCDTISFEAAVSQDDSVKVLLEGKRPYRIAHVSNAFNIAYGTTSEILMSRTLSMIHGPKTDALTLSGMLDGALKGSRLSTRIQTYRYDGSEIEDKLSHLSATPVMRGGIISHVLVEIGHTCAKVSSTPWSGIFPTEQDLNCKSSDCLDFVVLLNDEAINKNQPSAYHPTPTSDGDVAAICTRQSPRPRRKSSSQLDTGFILSDLQLAVSRLRPHRVATFGPRLSSGRISTEAVHTVAALFLKV